MKLEKKYSGDTTDQAAANTFINWGRNQSQQGKNQTQRDTLLKLTAKTRKILVHDYATTLLPFLAEASQLQHIVAYKKPY